MVAWRMAVLAACHHASAAGAGAFAPCFLLTSMRAIVAVRIFALAVLVAVAYASPMHRINRMGGFVDQGVDPTAPEGIYAQLPVSAAACPSFAPCPRIGEAGWGTICPRPMFRPCRTAVSPAC